MVVQGEFCGISTRLRPKTLVFTSQFCHSLGWVTASFLASVSSVAHEDIGPENVKGPWVAGNVRLRESFPAHFPDSPAHRGRPQRTADSWERRQEWGGPERNGSSGYLLESSQGNKKKPEDFGWNSRLLYVRWIWRIPITELLTRWWY